MDLCLEDEQEPKDEDEDTPRKESPQPSSPLYQETKLIPGQYVI